MKKRPHLTVVSSVDTPTAHMSPEAEGLKDLLTQRVLRASKKALMPGNIVIDKIIDYKKIGLRSKYVVLLVKSRTGKRAILLFNSLEGSFSIIRISEAFMKAMMRSPHDPKLTYGTDYYTVAFSIVDCDGEEYNGVYESPL